MQIKWLFIPVTRGVTGRRKRFRPYKVIAFLIGITSRVDLVMFVCLKSLCMLRILKSEFLNKRSSNVRG